MKAMQKILAASSLGALTAALSPLQAQPVLTAEDMFNQVGQYYRAYSSAGDVPLTGVLGSAGGPQFWDFSRGPTDKILRFDIVSPTEDGVGQDFSQATFAERKTDESDGSQEWLFMSQVPQGRRNFGFYSAQFSADKPSTPFEPPMIDFPAVINYGDSWTAATTYRTIIATFGGDDDPIFGDEEDGGIGQIEIPAIIHYNATATVDAYGMVNLPNRGFGEALRVNELVEMRVDVDIFGDGEFQTVATEYIRNYYWLREDHGIAVQITSKQSPSPPADDFPLAAAFVRLFETNHPEGQATLPSITDFRIEYDKARNRVALFWAKLPTSGSYRVEYTENPGDPSAWQELETTANTFVIDSTPGAHARFYRVVAVSN